MHKLLCLFLFSVTIIGCRINTDTGKQKVITVSILPQKTFIQKIAGDEFAINVLVPPGSSPAAYSLSPSQMTNIAKSAVWFRIGHIGFEYSWAKNISQINSKMKVFDLSEGLDLIKREDAGSGNSLVGFDPHTWLSPACVKLMAARIMDILSDINPKENRTYKINYQKFAREIDSLNIQIKNIFRDVQSRKFIVFHPTLSYFARDYGLQQISLEPGGKEPTPQTMVNVLKTAKEEGIKVIYIQSEVDTDQAKVFADETGGKIVRLNPLDPSWNENLLLIATTLHDNMR